LAEEAAMRGTDHQQSTMFSYISVEERVPKDHPLRTVRAMSDQALKGLGQQFEAISARIGRPSIAPEKLMRALLLQMLYTVRSERMLMEELNYNFLFRWFVGLSIDDPVWDATVFSKNRDRLLGGEVANSFFTAALTQARERGLLTDEHFTVDGTLIEAWAGHKSFKRRDDSDSNTPPTTIPAIPAWTFHGQRRSNDTHQSTTDPEALLARKGKGKESKLSYAGHVVMENRHGLAVNGRVTQATGRAEPQAALCDGRADPRLAPAYGRCRQKVTTVKSWCRKCASIELRRTSRVNEPVPSMSVLRATPDMRSVSASANGWRRSSVG
jgi:transposase